MRWLLIAFVLLAPGVQAETLAGTVISVVDGDTLTILDAQKRRYRVRLGQVDAPESKQAFGLKCVDANAEQVRRGMAWVSPKSTQPGSLLYELEAYARVRGIGLWSDPRPIPPWDWRLRKQTP